MTGEDITYNAQFIDAIPESSTADPPEPEIRGEVFFSTENFERINDEQMIWRDALRKSAYRLPERSGNEDKDGGTQRRPEVEWQPVGCQIERLEHEYERAVYRLARWCSRPTGSELAKESMSPRKARPTHSWRIWASP